MIICSVPKEAVRFFLFKKYFEEEKWRPTENENRNAAGEHLSLLHDENNTGGAIT